MSPVIRAVLRLATATVQTIMRVPTGQVLRGHAIWIEVMLGPSSDWELLETP